MANQKRRPRHKKERSEFDQKLLDLARVTRVVKGGRRFSFRATVAIGNRKGKVGVGVAKGADVSVAISKAVADAKKNLSNILRTNSTISFEVREKFGAAKVMIKPAKEGKGIVAGGAMRSVIELAGIRNITAKSFGSSNKINVAKATIKALAALEGKKVDDGSKKTDAGEEKSSKTDSGKKKDGNKAAPEAAEAKKNEKKQE